MTKQAPTEVWIVESMQAYEGSAMIGVYATRDLALTRVPKGWVPQHDFGDGVEAYGKRANDPYGEMVCITREQVRYK